MIRNRKHATKNHSFSDGNNRIVDKGGPMVLITS